MGPAVESADSGVQRETPIPDGNIVLEGFLLGGFMIKTSIWSNICPIKSVIGILAENQALH